MYPKRERERERSINYDNNYNRLTHSLIRNVIHFIHIDTVTIYFIFMPEVHTESINVL